MSTGYFGNGGTLKIGSTTISELTSITPPGFEADDIDVTTHNSDKVREFIKGLIDPGEITYEGNFNYTDYANAYASMMTTSLQSITITLPTLPSATKFECNGYMKNLECEDPHDDKIPFSGGIKVSGKPVLTQV